MQVIYIDTLFITNLLINYLILLATARVCAHAISRWRIALGALIGAAYSVLTIVPDYELLENPVIMVVVAAIMMLIVFGGERGLVRTGVIFLAISAAFGGAVLAVSLITGKRADQITISLRVLIISFLICYGIMSVVFARLGRREAAGGMVKVELRKGDRSSNFTALIDSGNSLVDPLTGRMVIVSELKPLLPLFTEDISRILKRSDDPLELLEKLVHCGGGYGFFLLPYTAVGVGGSFLLAFRPDEVKVGGKVNRKMSIAISPTCVSDGGVYSALVNGGAQ